MGSRHTIHIIAKYIFFMPSISLSFCEIYRAYIELCSISSMRSPQDMCDLIA